MSDHAICEQSEMSPEQRLEYIAQHIAHLTGCGNHSSIDNIQSLLFLICNELALIHRRIANLDLGS
jgi:hypothetical protein